MSSSDINTSTTSNITIYPQNSLNRSSYYRTMFDTTVLPYNKQFNGCSNTLCYTSSKGATTPALDVASEKEPTTHTEQPRDPPASEKEPTTHTEQPREVGRADKIYY